VRGARDAAEARRGVRAGVADELVVRAAVEDARRVIALRDREHLLPHRDHARVRLAEVAGDGGARGLVGGGGDALARKRSDGAVRDVDVREAVVAQHPVGAVGPHRLARGDTDDGLRLVDAEPSEGGLHLRAERHQRTDALARHGEVVVAVGPDGARQVRCLVLRAATLGAPAHLERGLGTDVDEDNVRVVKVRAHPREVDRGVRVRGFIRGHRVILFPPLPLPNREGF